MRITQQQDCYAAQEVLSDGETFTDIAAVQRWVDGLRDTHWWQLQGYSLHVLRIECSLLRKNSKWNGVAHWEPSMNAGSIALHPERMRVRTILHEVAHVLADAIHKSTGHDPAWARIYLTLVSCVMGSDEYVKLRDSFDAHGVNYDVETRAASSAFAL